MTLSPWSSLFLLAFAVWSWVIWTTLVGNIWVDDKSWSLTGAPTAFLYVHVTLAVVSLIFGTVIGVLGYRGWRASR